MCVCHVFSVLYSLPWRALSALQCAFGSDGRVVSGAMDLVSPTAAVSAPFPFSWSSVRTLDVDAFLEMYNNDIRACKLFLEVRLVTDACRVWCARAARAA